MQYEGEANDDTAGKCYVTEPMSGSTYVQSVDMGEINAKLDAILKLLGSTDANNDK